MKLAVVNRSEIKPQIYSSNLKTHAARSIGKLMCLSHYKATHSRKILETISQKNQLNRIVSFPGPLHVLPILINFTHRGS
jgi:hypothetical protein